MSGLRLPTYFVSHGSPMMGLGRSPPGTIAFWKSIGQNLEANFGSSIKAICVISAHWESSSDSFLSNGDCFKGLFHLVVSGSPNPQQIYDFGAFARELFEVQYPLTGSPEIANMIQQELASNGVKATIDPRRGIDHGAWVPLVNMIPDGKYPVLQLSLRRTLDPKEHIALGKALRNLRDKGVLLLGSGGAVHNLGDFDLGDEDAHVENWAIEFGEKLKDAVVAGTDDMLKLLADNPALLQKAHPRTEHLIPIFVFAGSLYPEEKAQRIHHRIAHASLSLDAYSN